MHPSKYICTTSIKMSLIPTSTSSLGDPRFAFYLEVVTTLSCLEVHGTVMHPSKNICTIKMRLDPTSTSSLGDPVFAFCQDVVKHCCNNSLYKGNIMFF